MVITYAGKTYDFETIAPRLDFILVGYIREQYSGEISTQRLMEEYAALLPWWTVFRGQPEAVEGVCENA